ncbi:MAG TPA: DUF1801 domain-containing protein [Longimicrobiales bacterium]|nr:DUF1801 domain-containing protein [Longimicrobiales bacterium]
MPASNTASPEDYLEGLPPDRRAAISAVREVILRNLPEGYVESFNWGMLSYEIPLERYPKTYNGKPLGYAALASQKNHMALYLMCAYMDPALMVRLRAGFQRAGKKLDMGKSCLRFRRLEDVPLDVIGKVIASTPPDAYIAKYEEARKR